MYNLQIQEVSPKSGIVVRNRVEGIKIKTLPEKTFKVGDPNMEKMVFNAIQGVAIPLFITKNNMEITIYVDGKNSHPIATSTSSKHDLSKHEQPWHLRQLLRQKQLRSSQDQERSERPD